MRLALTIIALVLAGCSTYWGSTTSDRPALKRPAVRADGAFWDAAAAAERGDAGAFRAILSPRFIHEGILPQAGRSKPESTEAFDAERRRLEEQLKPYEATVRRLVQDYMQAVAALTSDRLVDVGQPSEIIEYKDRHDNAMGPNRATIRVQTWAKGAQGTDAKPETLVVHFVQDRQRWLIDDLEPNRLKGRFAR